MSLRSADLRFVVPHEVSTAIVLGSRRSARLGRLRAGLVEAGVHVVDGLRRNQPVDLVVAGGYDGRAVDLPGRAHLLLGAPAFPSAKLRGRDRLGLLVRGDVATADTVLPVSSSRPLAHHLTNLRPQRGRRAQLRDIALTHLGRGPVPLVRLLPGTSRISLVGPVGSDLRPGLLRAAESLGIEAGCSWVLDLGSGDELQRAVFHVLRPSQEGWVVKFSRVTGYDRPFLRDETGLSLARTAGPRTRAHVPEHLGRLQYGGLTASVETAGAGGQLLHLLPDRPVLVLEAIASWVIGMGAESRQAPQLLDRERVRLRQVLAAAGPSTGAPADLVDRVPAVPAVLQHNDLGSWNILSDGQGFTVVDWESAQPTGLPLWDMLYFAADVLARLDGPAEPSVLVQRTLQICAGESPRSEVLFRWLSAAAHALHVPTAAIGPLAALCWLHHAQSATRRNAALSGASPAPLGHLALLAPAWLAHPALGAGWPALRVG